MRPLITGVLIGALSVLGAQWINEAGTPTYGCDDGQLENMQQVDTRSASGRHWTCSDANPAALIVTPTPFANYGHDDQMWCTAEWSALGHDLLTGGHTPRSMSSSRTMHQRPEGYIQWGDSAPCDVLLDRMADAMFWLAYDWEVAAVTRGCGTADLHPNNDPCVTTEVDR